MIQGLAEQVNGLQHQQPGVGVGAPQAGGGGCSECPILRRPLKKQRRQSDAIRPGAMMAHALRSASIGSRRRTGLAIPDS